MIEICENIKEKRYKRFINYLLKHGDRFAFVVNKQMMEFAEERFIYIENLISNIKDYLIEIRTQREWETTKLSNGNTAYVYYFQFNNAIRDFLIDTM